MSTNRNRVLIWQLVIAAALAGVSYSSVTALDDWVASSRAARKQNPVAADAKSVAAGKTTYAANCFACHGASGKGDGPAAAAINPPPKDLSDPKIASQSDGALFWKITTGRRPMPAFETLVSENDRWNVVNYVRTLEPASAKNPPSSH